MLDDEEVKEYNYSLPETTGQIVRHFLTTKTDPVFKQEKERVTTLDIDAEDPNSTRGRKLRKDRHFVKSFLKIWLGYCLMITILTLIGGGKALKNER